MAEKLIAPRICGYCHEPFTPRGATQRFCPKPFRCAYQWQSRERKGIAPLAAIAGKRIRDRRVVQARIQSCFGDLSDRELAIYQRGHRDGYDAGFNTAYFTRKRSA